MLLDTHGEGGVGRRKGWGRGRAGWLAEALGGAWTPFQYEGKPSPSLTKYSGGIPPEASLQIRHRFVIQVSHISAKSTKLKGLILGLSWAELNPTSSCYCCLSLSCAVALMCSITKRLIQFSAVQTQRLLPNEPWWACGCETQKWKVSIQHFPLQFLFVRILNTRGSGPVVLCTYYW